MTALEREKFVEFREKLMRKINELEQQNLDYSNKIAYDNVFLAITTELEIIKPVKNDDFDLEVLFDYTKENQYDTLNLEVEIKENSKCITNIKTYIMPIIDKYLKTE